MNSIKSLLLEDKDQLGGSYEEVEVEEEEEVVEEVEELHYFTCPSIVDHRETEARDTELTFSDKKYLKVLTLTD